MAGQFRTIALITALLGSIQPSCALRGADAESDRPSESTYALSSGQLQQEDQITEVKLARVTTEFFAALNRPPWLGRTLTAQDFENGATPVAVVSHELWEQHLGGTPEIIGRVLQLDGGDRTVIGVMPAAIDWPPGAQLWIAQSSQP